MKKKLNLDALSIKSFVTDGQNDLLQTVKGGALPASYRCGNTLDPLPNERPVWLTEDGRHICRTWH